MRPHVHAQISPLAAFETIVAVLILVILASLVSAGELHEAVKAGDVAKVRTLLKTNPGLVATPDETDQYRSLPLHLAATAGNVEIAGLLLDAGADIECGDSDESTPLDNAALNHHPEMVAFLLSKGADVNRRDKNGACAISFAAAGGDTAILGQLMRAGADLNFRDNNGYTLVHFAVGRDLRGLLDILIARGANLEAAATEGLTPLHNAAGRGRTEMVRLLLERGANHSPVDGHGQTPLFGAAINNRAEVVGLLLDAGADVNVKDQMGNTPLLQASWRGSLNAMQVLIAHGADVDAANTSGDTPLFSAVGQGNADVVEALLQAGADVGLRDPNFGATVLHEAAVLGYREVAEDLIAGGADINARDNAGSTPLDYAARYGHKTLAEFLDTRGAEGDLSTLETGTLEGQGSVGRGEAVVWYLNHSGYAVKTRNHLLIFDYFSPNPDPLESGLANGHINPKELADQNVMVFATHQHSDHFTPAIFEWRRDLPDVKYVLGCRPDSAPRYDYMGPREVRTIDGVKITTIKSNDPGVGFWVETDGLVIYHAGDHANRWRDFSGPYKEEIDFLAAAGKRPDIAFMPISGCNFGDQEAVKMGVCYALETLKPLVFLPMHSGGGERRYVQFVNELSPKYPGIRMVAPMARGDHFRYRDGRTS